MTTTIIRRDQWGAMPRGASRSSHPIGATRGVTFHWEGPRMGAFPHSECAGKVRGIERFHRQTRRWADIAYNALVCPHGYVYEGRGPGVKSAANGNSSTNGDWYAVCYLGGVGDGFTDAGRRAFVAARAWLIREGDAGPAVNGHRDHKATACPGDDIYRWLHATDFDNASEEFLDMDEKAAEALFRRVVREELDDLARQAGQRLRMDNPFEKDPDKEWPLDAVLASLVRRTGQNEEAGK